MKRCGKYNLVCKKEQAANMRDEAWPNLEQVFQRHYAILDKCR